MSSNYSYFNTPVDLSLSGSQVSPTRKLNSARSVKSTRSSASIKSQDGNSFKGRAKSSSRTGEKKSRTQHTPHLAMSFPAKENQRPKQTNLRESLVSNDDFLTSFFDHPKPKKSSGSARSKGSSITSKRSVQAPKSHAEERVFKIPDSVRSSLTTARSEISTYPGAADDPSLMHDGDVDYLRTYLSNVDKYRDDNHDDVIDATSARHSRVSVEEEQDDAQPLTKSMLEVIAPDGSQLEAIEGSGEDVMQFKRAHAARVIQRRFRRHLQLKMRETVKTMLSQKMLEKQTAQSLTVGARTRSEDEVKTQRAQKAKEARKKAIEELRKKRNSEREAVKKIADEEVERVKKKIESRKKVTQKKTNNRTEEARARGDAPDGVPFDKLSEASHSQSEHRNRLAASMDCVDGADRDADNRPLSPSGSTDVKHPAGDVLKQRTTLDDVLETIKLLEEEPEHLKESKPSKSALDEKLSWMDDLQSDHNSALSKRSVSAVPAPDLNNLLTEAKLHSIMNYLDEVERKTPPESNVGTTDSTQQLIQAEQAATEVTSQMLKMKLDLEEKTKSVTLLQKALVQHRELSVKQAQEQERELQHRMQLQKKQYESTIQRHLSFIDQLIDDKKLLNEKCEKLVLEMKLSGGKYQSRIKLLTDNHQAEMKKAKELMAATEKVRRERWIEEKTTKIKEMTVKGLEPEIQRLILKHKEEIKKVKAIHEAELLQSDERAGQRYIRQTEELREQLEREKEAACTREREMARLRYEKQMEQEEVALQQQRKRMFSEVAEEKERMSQQAARQRSELDQLKHQLEDNSRIASSTLREEYEKNMADTAKRHADELQALRERLDIEKQAWQENYMKKQESFLLQKERELKEAVRRDRDQEIELVIHRLEEDMHQQRGEHEKATENRIKRVRDKYETEMKELERSEKQTQEKYNNMKVEFNRIEGENLQLQSLCKQKEQEVVDANKIKDKLVHERGNISDVIRQEFADRLVITEEENKRMKTDLSELRARHRLELERINNEKEEELTEVQKRVRQAIVKKEETIAQIREQHEAACKRADHLEALLEAQRKKLLGKKK